METTSELSQNTTAVTNSSEISHHGNTHNDLASKDLDQYLWIFISPFMLVIGVVGNILLVLTLRRLRHQSKCPKSRVVIVYFTFMAIADIIFLLSGIIPEWIQAMGYGIVSETHYVICKLERFIFYTSGDVAIWIICIINIDRFFAVRYPLREKFTCIIDCLQNPFYISIGTVIIAILKNLHVFWTRGAVYDEDGNLIKNCGRPEQFVYFEDHLRPWLVTVVVAIIPCLIIMFCNIWIIITLRNMHRDHARDMIMEHDSDSKQTVFMCLCASIAFLVCIPPSTIIYIGRVYWTDPDHQENNPYAYDIAKAINNQLVYVNHAINFFLYCASGKRFRKAFKSVITCSKYEERNSYAAARYSQHNHSVNTTPLPPKRNGHHSMPNSPYGSKRYEFDNSLNASPLVQKRNGSHSLIGSPQGLKRNEQQSVTYTPLVPYDTLTPLGTSNLVENTEQILEKPDTLDLTDLLDLPFKQYGHQTNVESMPRNSNQSNENNKRTNVESGDILPQIENSHISFENAKEKLLDDDSTNYHSNPSDSQDLHNSKLRTNNKGPLRQISRL